jgi:uncharacterized protein YjiK
MVLEIFHTMNSIIAFLCIVMVGLTLPGSTNAESLLNAYDFSRSGQQVDLGEELREISGIAFTPDGRMFAHNDEQGTIYELQPENGSVIKQFCLRKENGQEEERIARDFEDIAIADNRFFMITGSGDIYEFREGMPGEEVKAEKHETFLSKEYDVEGLCYDPARHALLITCKSLPKSLRKTYGTSKKSFPLPVFVFYLEKRAMKPQPAFLLPERLQSKSEGGKKFKPSAIALASPEGNMFLLSSHAMIIAEFSPSGTLLGYSELSPEQHPQPEGLALDNEANIFIADEGTVYGKLTTYTRK